MITLFRITCLVILCLLPVSLLFAPTPSSPWALASADFDADGKADLIVAGPDERGVRILLSSGKTVHISLETTPVALAAGDINGDGRQDLVIASPSYVSVYLSNGDGTFQEPVKYDPGDSPIAIAVGDVNGDGRADLIVLGARSHRVSVLLSNANGTMQAPMSYEFGRMPTALAVGDFNRDGRLDLVVADAGTNELLLALGNGDGTFQQATSYAAGPLPRSLAVGDFNGDGIADVAVTGLGDGKVRLLLGTSRGTLEPGSSYDAGMGWTTIAAADLEGRGTPDLVWANANTGTLSTLRGRGDGSFSNTRAFAAARATAASTITLASVPTGSVTFGQPVTLTATVSPSAATGKVTFYDGTTILGVATLSGGKAVMTTILLAAGHKSLTALYGGDPTYASSVSTPVALTVNTNPSGGFRPAPGNPFAVGYGVTAVAVGDFNGDGRQDLATANNGSDNVTVLLGDGLGGFTPAHGSPFALGGSALSLAVGDFNGDGKSDLAVSFSYPAGVTIMLGDGNGGFTVAAGSPFGTGTNPYYLAAGDFNGDGKADVVFVDRDTDTLTVLLGDGSGGLTTAPGSPVTVGSHPFSVVVGDFNGDGKQDLATANLDSVTLLLGNGSGGFTQASGSPYLAPSPHLLTAGLHNSIVTGDFNDDGKTDLAVTNSLGTDQIPGTITVLLGNGNGGFTVASSPRIANFPTYAVVGDFNGDGELDLAVSTHSVVNILLGNGRGSFAVTATSAFTRDQPGPLAVGDFNGDGKTDLAVTRELLTGNVFVLLGVAPSFTALTAAPNPSTFGQSVTLTASVNPSNATGLVTFYDGTTVLGETPLLGGSAALSTIGLQTGLRYLRAFYGGNVTYASNTSGVVPLTVNAKPSNTLTAAAGSPIAVGSFPQSIISGDFNGDGKPDLAITNYGSDTVTVLLGNGSGGFTPAPGSPMTVGTGPAQLAAGDFNGDGKTDLAVAGNNTVTVLLGNGSGGFTIANTVILNPIIIGPPRHAGPPLPRTFYAGPLSGSMAVADINGDGNADLIIAGFLLLGDGIGGFKVSGLPNAPLAVGDFNGDGIPDLAVALYGDALPNNNSVVAYMGDGRGGFASDTAVPFKVGTQPVFITTGDFNGDGKLDLAVANVGDDNISVLLGDGSGGFTAAPGSPFAAGFFPIAIAVGDLNGDGKLDLAVANIGSNAVTVLLGNGSGGFTAAPRSPFAVGTNPIALTIADFNGDGRADLAVANKSNDVTVLLGASAAHALSDFDGNGVPDLVWMNNSTHQVTVNYSGGAGGASQIGWDWLNQAGQPGWHLAAVADFDRNGIPDLVWVNDSTRQVTVNYYGGPGGTTLIGFNFLYQNAPAGWHIVGAGDFNGDGVPDLVWQNDTTNQVTVNYFGGNMGATLTGWNYLNAQGIPGWHVVAVADFNSDGVSDLVWMKDDTHQVTVHYYGGAGGTTFSGWNFLNSVGVPGWHIIGARDLDNNGTPDLIWYNDSTTQITVNYYSGATLTGFAYLYPGGSPSGWTPIN